MMAYLRPLLVLLALLVTMAGAQQAVAVPLPPDHAEGEDVLIQGTNDRFSEQEWLDLSESEHQEYVDHCHRTQAGGRGSCVIRGASKIQSTPQKEELGSWATQLFNYAMGLTGSSSCLTCDFIGYFMLALTNFSSTLFDYFLGAFKMIAPVLIAIWIAYRVAKLMSVGGEDGRSFIYSIVQKLALFAVIWLITTSSLGSAPGTGPASGTPNLLWRGTGPIFLETAFGLSGEIRDNAIGDARGLGADGGGGVPFGCDGIKPAVGEIITSADTDYVRAGLEITCVTERTHMIGISSGLAVVFTAWNGAQNLGGNWYERLAGAVLLGLIKLFAGTVMMAVYILSAVWLIFLILDVVTRALITAAFSPVITAMYLFQPTRGFATGAVKALAGALVTAIALSIISVLAFFLMSNVVDVYNAMMPTVAENYADYNLQPITDGSMIDRFGEFIARIQEDEPGAPTIPMDFSTPWFYYICMAGVATFALGKKIIAMLEGMIGYQGASAFADNALKMTKTGAMAGMGAAGIGAILAKKGGGMALGGAGFASAGGAAAAGKGAAMASEAGKAAGNRFLNPFNNPASGAAQGSLSSAAMKGKMGAEIGAGALNAADEPPAS